MPDLQGKVAFITGAARGQGRAHAVRLAAAGADVIAVDACRDIPSLPYPMATPGDLDDTVRLVEKEGRRVSGQVVDIRDRVELAAACQAGLAALSAPSPDIVVANAGGIAYPTPGEDDDAAFRGQLELILVGTWNTLQVTVPGMVEAGRGGSIVLTSSTSSLKGFIGGTGGLDGYTAAKTGLVGLMRFYANHLAPHRIRVNTIHPTGVNSGMVLNEAFAAWAATVPDPTVLANPMPLELLEPDDVAGAVAWLASDDARWVTGVALPVDGGFVNK